MTRTEGELTKEDSMFPGGIGIPTQQAAFSEGFQGFQWFHVLRALCGHLTGCSHLQAKRKPLLTAFQTLMFKASFRSLAVELLTRKLLPIPFTSTQKCQAQVERLSRTPLTLQLLICPTHAIHVKKSLAFKLLLVTLHP